MVRQRLKSFLNINQFFTLFFYLEQVIAGWEKFTQMQIFYLNKRRIFLIGFTKQKNGRGMLLQLILIKVFLYEVYFTNIDRLQDSRSNVRAIAILSVISTHKHSDIRQALSVNNTAQQPAIVFEPSPHPPLLCPSPLLFKQYFY